MAEPRLDNVGRTDVGRTDSWSLIDTSTRADDAAAKLERFARAPSEIEARARCLDLLALRPGEVVVDVGAGAGSIAVDMGRRVAPGGRVFAVDPSQLLLDHARARARQVGIGHAVDCRVADGRDLPFGPAAFDAAFCHWVLLHVDPPEAVISEMRRVTRGGGRVMCVEIDWETGMVHPGAPAVTRRILQYSAGRHIDGWIGRKLAVLFRQCGLQSVSVEPMVTTDHGGGDRTWLEFLHERAEIAREAGVVEEDEAGAWVEALDEGFATGDFFFGFVQFAVLGRVPL